MRDAGLGRVAPSLVNRPSWLTTLWWLIFSVMNAASRPATAARPLLTSYTQCTQVSFSTHAPSQSHTSLVYQFPDHLNVCCGETTWRRDQPRGLMDLSYVLLSFVLSAKSRPTRRPGVFLAPPSPSSKMSELFLGSTILSFKSSCATPEVQ